MLTFVVLLLAIASVPSSLAEKRSDISGIKEVFAQKYPELVHWYDRAAERIHNNATASEADLEEVRHVLRVGQQKIYDFVNSPLYTIVGGIMVQKTVDLVSPLLGILPLKEFREFMKIISKQPELIKLVFVEPQDPASIEKVLPHAAVFDQWLTNSTKQIVDHMIDTAMSDDEEDVPLLGGGFVADSGRPGAPGAPGSPGGRGGSLGSLRSSGAPGGSSGSLGVSGGFSDDDAPGAPGAPGARSFS